MQMAFGGGIGICGIHSNPCGGGTCEDAGNGGYTCTCLDPLFIAVADKGGAQTCVFADVCSMQDDNPCAVGTCINDNAGGFFCLCPTGFEQGYRPSGAHTCVPTIHPTYTVSFPIDIDCPLVYQLYGLTEENFLAQNLQLNMEHCYTIPANTQVSVAPPLTGAVHCVLNCSWTAGDLCEGVAEETFALLNISHDPHLNLPTPHLPPTPPHSTPPHTQNMEHCYTIPANTQVSIAPPLMGAVHCVLYYSWTANDTCQSLADYFWLTVDDLVTLNPGINCTDSTAWNAPCVNQQVRCSAVRCGA
ncbi:unnamed protein product [Closterium sp. NIES-54]